MSVIIKGMKMPKNCGECPLKELGLVKWHCLASSKKVALIDYTNIKPDWCPLVKIQKEREG